MFLFLNNTAWTINMNTIAVVGTVHGYLSPERYRE